MEGLCCPAVLEILPELGVGHLQGQVQWGLCTWSHDRAQPRAQSVPSLFLLSPIPLVCTGLDFPGAAHQCWSQSGEGISIEGSGVVTPQDSSGALPSA